MKKNPKLAISRHASDPKNHPSPIIPPGGGTTPNNPCSIAAEQLEYELRLACQSKHNKMVPGCCCTLKPEDHHLPHLNNAADASLLNTANDGTGGVLPLHSPDTVWEVATSLGGPWAPAMVCDEPPPVSWLPGPIGGADWISIEGDARPGPGAGSPGDFYFRVRFVLCEGIDPANFVLHTSILADDSLQEIYVNGVAQGGGYAVNMLRPTGLDLANNWQPCVNEIVFFVQSTMTWLGFLAQFSIDALPAQVPCGECECEELELPKVEPCFSVSWGDSDCDCLETTDFEVLCITACNCYSNLTFEHLTIHQISVVDEFGNPVPNLPDGMPCVEVIPFGPICFDDLGPCIKGQPNCKSRQVVLRTCGALSGKYYLKLSGICYEICYNGSAEVCFEFSLCKD